MAIVSLGKYHTQSSGLVAMQVLDTVSRLNAAVWTGYGSVQVASAALRTPTPWSGGVAVAATISAAASFAYAAIEAANLASLLSTGSEIDDATMEKVEQALDLLEDPLAVVIEALELVLTGSSVGSDTHALLDAAKEAIETMKNSDNQLERLAAFEKARQAIIDIIKSWQNAPTQPPAEPVTPIQKEPFDLRPPEFGPLAGEPYHDPDTAYV